MLISKIHIIIFSTLIFTILSASTTESLIYKALYHKSNGEILEYKHTLAKAIKESDGNSSIAKNLYWNGNIYTGRLEEYLSIDAFHNIDFVELNKDKNLLYINTEEAQIIWDINQSRILPKAKRVAKVKTLYESRLHSSTPLNYIDSGYKVYLSPFDINITGKGKKISSHSEYFILSNPPLFSSDYIIFSRYDSNSGNVGYPVTIKSYENETILTYQNEYNIANIFLSPKRDLLISYTPNQINITPLKELDILKSIQIDTFIDGIQYLKDGFVAYWYKNKISIIKISKNRYKKIATLYNIGDVNTIFFNEKSDKLMVIGEKSFAKWNISMFFDNWSHNSIQLKENESISFYVGLSRLGTNDDREIFSHNSKNELYVEEDKVIIYDIKNKQKLLVLKHNLLTNNMEKHSLESTFAKYSEDKKRLLSWSCFKGRDIEEGCFCKLFLTDIRSGINLIKRDEGCIKQAGFTQNNNSIYVKYYKQMYRLLENNQNGDMIYIETDKNQDGIYIRYNKMGIAHYIEADKITPHYNEDSCEIYDVTYDKDFKNRMKYHENNSKFYVIDNFTALKNSQYPLQTIINTATKYDDGELKLLTPNEWNNIQ